jgi:hypothetical protein
LDGGGNLRQLISYQLLVTKGVAILLGEKMFARRKPAFVPARHLSAKKTVKIRRNDPSKPAANVDLIKKVGVDFTKRVDSAVKINMQKGGSHAGVRWSVIGLLDESGSMYPYFNDGTVQEITERALAWCASVDNDGMAPFGAFGSHHIWHEDVDLSNVAGIVNNSGWRPWGSTNLASSLQAILDMIHQMGDGWDADPILLFIVTDGSPDSQAAVKNLVCELSQYPVFIKILRVGNDPGAKAFTEFLDNMESHSPGARLVDNVDCPEDSLTKGMSNDKFNGMMTEETDSYLIAAKAAGLVSE